MKIYKKGHIASRGYVHYHEVKQIEEKVRAMIWKIAQEEGGQILHYNEIIDEIFNKE